MPILIILLILVVIFIIPCIKVVPQAKRYVIERLGSYYETWDNGLHFLVPFIDKVREIVTLKEIVKDFPPQPVITKDNVTMQIDTVVYFQITDAKLFTFSLLYTLLDSLLCFDLSVSFFSKSFVFLIPFI